MATIDDRPFSKNYSGLINQSVIAVCLGAVCITAHEIMKRKRRGRRRVDGLGSVETWEFGYLYQGRSWAQQPSPPTPRGWPLSWVVEVVNFPEPKLNELRGVDATLYARFLRGCAWFAFLHTFTTVPILLPIHVHFSDNSVSPRSMTRASISSLVSTQAGGKLLWIHLVLLYYLTFTWMATLLWICRGVFAYRNANIQASADQIVSATHAEHDFRHGLHPHPQYPFLSLPSTIAQDESKHNRGLRLRTVMVTNVPRALRSERELAEYFQYYLSRPIDLPYMGLPSAVQPGFFNKSTAFIFNRAKRIPDFLPHQPRVSKGNENVAGAQQPARQVPVIDCVVIARKMTELQSLLERREDILRLLEIAHIKLAKKVLAAVKQAMDERQTGNPFVKNPASRISMHRLSQDHEISGAHLPVRPTRSTEAEETGGGYMDLLIRELAPFVEEFGLLSSPTIHPSAGKPMFKYFIGPILRIFDSTQLSTEKYKSLSDMNGRTIWDVLHSLPRPALDPYQPFVRLRTLFSNTTVPSIDYYNAKYAVITNLITENRAKAVTDFDPVSTAFVTFADPKDARRACKYLAVHPDNPLACFVTMVPGFEDLDWTRIVKDWVVDIGVWAFTLSWVFPVSFFVGLVSIQNISTFWPGLNHYLEHHPWEEELIQSLLPTLLVALLSLLIPLILLFIGKKAHTIITLSALHDRIMTRYYKFLIVNVLVFFCVGTATLQSFLVSFASNQGNRNILEIVSSSFPSAGPFYVGWMIFTTGMHGAIELVLCDRSTSKVYVYGDASVLNSCLSSLFLCIPLRNDRSLHANVQWAFDLELLTSILSPSASSSRSQESVAARDATILTRRPYPFPGPQACTSQVKALVLKVLYFQTVFVAYMIVLKRRVNIGLSIILIVFTVTMKLLLTRVCRAKFERDDMREADIVCGTGTGTDDPVDGHPSDINLPVQDHTQDAENRVHAKVDSTRSWRDWRTWRLPSEVIFSYATFSPPKRNRARRQPNPFTTQLSFSRLRSVDGLGSQNSSPEPIEEHGRRQPLVLSPSSEMKAPALVSSHPPFPAWDDESDPSHPYENPYYDQPISNALWLPRNPFGTLDLDDTVDVQLSLTTSPEKGQLGTRALPGGPLRPPVFPLPLIAMDELRGSYTLTTRRLDGSESVSMPLGIASRINALEDEDVIDEAEEGGLSLFGRYRKSSVGTAWTDLSLRGPNTIDRGPSAISRTSTTSATAGMRPQLSLPSSFRSALGGRIHGRTASLTQELGIREEPRIRTDLDTQMELTSSPQNEVVVEEAIVEEQEALEEPATRRVAHTALPWIIRGFKVSRLLALFSTSVRGGTTIWSGSFNAYSSVSVFDNWSWSNEVGEYQWYIHGSEPTSHYLALDPSYKNPADTSETNGLRATIDSTATWNSQMERTELIPQTTENLGTGNLFYHFSIMRDDTSPPESTLEHQILFFESHFTEASLKYGVSPNQTYLEWHVSSNPQWGLFWEANTWYNFAYDIDFSAGTVGLWFSEGSAQLTKVFDNISASTSTNSEDWHVGVLRIVNDDTPENFYFSGVYIESGPITTIIGSGGSASSSSAPSSSTATSASSAPASSSTTVASTSTAATTTQTQWGQCGGTGYTGPTTCVSGTTCISVSPPYYYQCQ
ncbi:hypothetical protein EW146_g1190 [Bondarzewia mesenterica]|uniref:CBM1 domain-containing protein n=1 Tax=Bondarzewia mesenterica TaxID=1095465 RepID=A0A4S4M6Z7_9AGAM|nr:hypothetical protein EW146_g1190 [Bondarzewia mesenterica]